MNKEKEIKMQEGIKKCVESLASSFGEVFDDFGFLKKLFTVENLLEELLTSYFTETESAVCSADKARFVAKRILRAIEEGKHLSLSKTYAEHAAENPENEDAQQYAKDDPDSICYWCPLTLKDTKQAVSLVLQLTQTFSLSRKLATDLKQEKKKVADLDYELKKIMSQVNKH